VTKVYLVDGTYELFRHYYGRGGDASDDAAVRGVLASLTAMLAGGVTHLGVATDHVIESFRNDLWPGYKTAAGVPPKLLEQFPLLEDALQAAGIHVWAMVELEADDALASAAAIASADPEVQQVVICTPDKDLSQSVRGTRVVTLDRRKDVVTDEDGVRARYGIGPESIPDWLALVGDSADGFPGIRGWGKQSASGILARFVHLEAIPDDYLEWHAEVRGAGKLAAQLAADRDLAYLFRALATLCADEPLLDGVEQLRWTGPGPELGAVVDDAALVRRLSSLRP
jgi:5'-3' exonuclease